MAARDREGPRISMHESGTFNNLLDRVNFLENFGLPSADAAKAAGSTKASVDVLRRRARKKKAGKNAKAKKKQGRGY